MYQLQLRYYNQGDWENTVYQPMKYHLAKALKRQYEIEWEGIHTYRLVQVNA